MVLVVPQLVTQFVAALTGLPNLMTVTEFLESAVNHFLSPYNHAP